MSILIEGMEMPTTCGNCWFCHAVSNEKWHCRLTGKSFASYSVGWGDEKNTGENGQHPYIRRDDCPLIEVPEPHGLIDRERILDSIRIELAQANAVNDMEDYDSWMRVFDYVRKFPTIIPASKEAE